MVNNHKPALFRQTDELRQIRDRFGAVTLVSTPSTTANVLLKGDKEGPRIKIYPFHSVTKTGNLASQLQNTSLKIMFDCNGIMCRQRNTI